MGEHPQQSILIIDDEPRNILELTNALSKKYLVIVATGVAQAISLAFTNSQLDLILLSTNLREIDGHQVCHKLKQDARTGHIPIILVTERADRENEVIGLQLGAADYISKPVHLPITLARIKNHLLLKRKSDLLGELVFVDGLTEIANRRKFDKRLSEEWRRCQRESIPLSLGIMDVDYFKSYNDIYGHAKGDSCLRLIAKAMNSVVGRPGDLVARYGGEEFASILPGTDFEGAKYVGNNFCKQLNELEIPHQGSEAHPYVTISVGVCSVHPGDEFNLGDLVQEADRLLYQAKKLGRNRCEANCLK